MRRGGWYGNPHGHALAARGIRTYSSKKAMLMDPIFYAKKREEEVPMWGVIDMVRQGKTLQEMKSAHPDADSTFLRDRGAKAIDQLNGNRVMVDMKSEGVDKLLNLAKEDGYYRKQMIDALSDRQKRSFIPEEKAVILKARLEQLN